MAAQRIDIPARRARAVLIEEGRRFRVVDVEGQQVVDLFAFAAADVGEYVSAEHTRVAVSRLFPLVGEHFVTNHRRPILSFERDASPGCHDMLCAACDPARYRALGVTGWHASCRENLETAMAELGYEHVEVPQPINLFMNTPVGPDGTIGWDEALTRAGDFVELRAAMDVIVVASACPQDLNPINGKRPTGIAVDLLL